MDLLSSNSEYILPLPNGNDICYSIKKCGEEFPAVIIVSLHHALISLRNIHPSAVSLLVPGIYQRLVNTNPFTSLTYIYAYLINNTGSLSNLGKYFGYTRPLETLIRADLA